MALGKSGQRVLVLMTLVILSACGGKVSKPDPVTTLNKPAVRDISHSKDGKDIKDGKATASATSMVKPAANSGGYYKDDGPGDNPPNIDAIPDATPKTEVSIPRANKPYSALGQSYRPMTQYTPYKARGTASWYGKRFHGQKTASGELYDMYGMTAAHTILPLTSYAKVTNPENGKSVIVRINDRGPFRSDRLIDLSYAAAYKLGLLAKGSGLVDVEAIDSRVSTVLKVPPAPAVVVAPTQTVAAVVAENASATDETVPITGVYLQAGAFKSRENADKLSQKITQKNLGLNVNMQTWYNAGKYRVWLGPFATKQEALAAAPKLKPATGNLPITVTQP